MQTNSGVGNHRHALSDSAAEGECSLQKDFGKHLALAYCSAKQWPVVAHIKQVANSSRAQQL